MRVIVIGGGGHGSVVIDILKHSPEFTLVGVLDSLLAVGTSVSGYEVLGPIENLREIAPAQRIEGAVVAVGDNWTRAEISKLVRAAAPHLKFPTIVHPAAQIGGNVRLGQGTVLMAGAIVNCKSQIGEFCILNTNSSVDHDSVLGDFVSFAPNSCAGGGVRVGDYSAVCLGANIIDHIIIGEHTVIGAGSTVLQNQSSYIVAYGTPARKTQDRRAGDKYLSSR